MPHSPCRRKPAPTPDEFANSLGDFGGEFPPETGLPVRVGVAIFREKNQSPLPKSLKRFAYLKLPAVQFLETLCCPAQLAHLIYHIYLNALVPRRLFGKT